MPGHLSRMLVGPRQYLGDVRRSHIARSVTVLATGTAVAQIIAIMFAPLITRIYTAEAFGLLGAFLALAAIVTPVAALSYPLAIVLPKEDRDAMRLAKLSVYLSLALAMLVAFVLWVWGKPIAGIAGVTAIEAFLLLIPLVMVFSAWLEIARNWLLRKKRFGMIAQVAVVQSLFLNSAKSAIGWFYPLAAVLILLATLGNVVHAAMLFFWNARRWPKDSVAPVNASGESMRHLAKHFRDFPLYRSPQILINSTSQSLPVLMLAGFFGPAAAGFYTLSRMVMGLPVTFISNAVMDVLYPRITEAAYAGANVSRLILKSTGMLLLIGIMPFGLVILFGPGLFSFVFGPEWGTAGEYARWLSLFYLFNFINKPGVAAVPVLGIQRGLLVYEVFSTGAKIVGLLIGFYWFGNDIWAVALFSVIGAVAYSAMMFWILLNASRWDKNAQAS